MEFIINTSDTERYNRQLEAVNKWYNNNGRGIAKIVPRFGKTNMGIIALDKMFKANPNNRVLIITPNQDVADSWAKYIKDIDFRVNIITIYMYKLYPHYYNSIFYNMVIIDEGHKYLQPETIKNFYDLKFRFSMVNMGVIDKSISIKQLSDIFGTIFDEITETYSIDKGFTSNYKEYNLLIDLPDDIKGEYAKYSLYISECNEMFKTSLNAFKVGNIQIINNTNDLLLGCLYGYKKTIFFGGNPRTYEYTAAELRDSISRAMGYNRDLVDDNKYNKDRIEHWSPYSIYEKAKKYKAFIDNRNKIHDNIDSKVYAVVDILYKVQKPTIIFTNSIEMCDKITHVINQCFKSDYEGGIAVSFNSNYKTDIYFSRTQGDYVRYKNGNPKPVGKDLYRRLIKEDIDNGFYKILVVVKSFNEGITFSNLKCAIITSSSINSIDDSQKKARIKNKSDLDDLAIVYNVAINDFSFLDYTIKSRDLSKLETRQQNSKGVECLTFNNTMDSLINSNINQAIKQFNAMLYNV